MFLRFARSGCVAALVVALAVGAPLWAQQQRERLILRDGSYQTVLDYEVFGSVVRFHSAERNGEAEEIPLKLVDLAATRRWKQEHANGSQKPVISADLARMEADRAAQVAEVAPDLHLPDDISVVALDSFQGRPELVPMPQQGGDLNAETGHDTLKTEVNPASSPHRLTDIAGEKADVQLHATQPTFFVRLDKPVGDEGSGSGMVVDTSGQTGRVTPSGSPTSSSYVLERVDVRKGQRRISSFRIAELGTGKPQRDVIELKHETLDGGYWLKLTLAGPLLPGEYTLVEVLDGRYVNADVWDFGVHPEAAENSEAILPQPKKAPTLERR
ncbi:MAG: hypothetical protein PW792_16985 [Acidobacteriaceae bacterium]|nr:hypothetical protein [Acidobacteriaceae bacterium]